MTRTAVAEARTYVTDDAEGAQILDFITALERVGRTAPESRPAIVDGAGNRHEIPEQMVAVLRQVADALAAGMGVTVAPRNARLTTQEAAEFLGVSRPTLVRMLERGDLPMEKPGRHRFVRLDELVAFQARRRTKRREVLNQMQAEGEADGLYDATDCLPPLTR